MTDSLKRRYQEYLDDFDPSPQYAGDDYNTPLDFDDWCAWQENCKEDLDLLDDEQALLI